MRLAVQIGVVVVVGSSLVGCGSSSVQRPTGQIAPTLPSNAAVYVCLPEDGVLNGTAYGGSGRATAAALAGAFDSRSIRTHIEESPSPLESSRAVASGGGFTHLVEPMIVRWEDRATEWSGRLDRVEVRLQMYELAGWKLLDTATLNGSSAWMTLGGDHPEDLLRRLFPKYVAEVVPAGSDNRSVNVGRGE